MTHWSAREFPWVATAQMIWTERKSTCKYGVESLEEAHHDGPLSYVSLPFLAGVVLSNSVEAVNSLSGILPPPKPRAVSPQSPEKDYV